MKKPERFRQFGDITARALNSHAQAIEELQAKIKPNDRRGRQMGSVSVKPNLWVSDTIKGGTAEAPTYKVSVTPGYLLYQLLLKQDDTGGPLHWETPTINDVSINSEDKEYITITGAGRIYLYCATSNRGVPTMTPTIDFYADQQESTHHVPESESSSPPVNGDYYWELAEIEKVPDSEPPSYRIKNGSRKSGDKFIPNQIDRLKNIGGEVQIYKHFKKDEALHELRTLQNLDEGTGFGVLKDDEDPVGDTIIFRKIDAKSDSPLQASMEDDVILIEGNGVGGTAEINFDGSIEVRDGIVEVINEGQKGSNFNLVNYPCQDSGPAPSPLWTIYFRNGLAFLSDPGGAPGSTLVQYDGFSCYPGTGGP